LKISGRVALFTVFPDYQPIPPKLQHIRNEIFLWLAGYQTCGWSRGRLAEAVGVERNAVGMGIKKLASALEIKLRADRLYDEKQTKELIAEQLERARAQERAAARRFAAKFGYLTQGSPGQPQ
jgi:hypothetical protein